MAADGLKSVIDSVAWQDYRSSNTGMIVYYGGDPISELPIREVPERYPSEIQPEPNYETGTFGFLGCARTKIRSTFVKSKIKYLLFVTKYVGTNEAFKEKYMVTGYYRINKIADVKRRHIRYCAEYSCLEEKVCYALRADEVRLVSAEDAYLVSPQQFKEWGFSGRLTRQSRILLDEEQTAALLKFLQGKPDITGKYIEETARLQPHVEKKEEDIEDDEDGE
ncbi:MAG: hypothetical protein LBC59_05300 [Chitinispirillales bacterium]|nr:hypothetical protein [Chitinispirillales bacterium]